MNRRLLFWCFGLVLVVTFLISTAFYLLSPRRDAEVALGLKWLPWSTKSLSISVDAWTDYVVRGYVEVSPADFEKVIQARGYERDDHKERLLNEEPLPQGRKLYATTAYRWSDGVAYSNLETDSSKSWIWFSYSTD